MSENADLEKKAIEALERYREAYARAEALEQEEAAARREVSRRLNRLEIAKAKGESAHVNPEVMSGRPPSVKGFLFGSANISGAVMSTACLRGRDCRWP